MKFNFAVVAFFAFWFIACHNEKAPSASYTPTGDPQLDSLSARIAKSPEEANLYHERALRYIELKKPTEALADINQAISLEPKKVEHRIVLSDVFFQMGKVTDCKKTLEQIWSEHPDNINIALKLAEVNLYFKDYSSTSENLDNAENIDKRDPRVHFMRGFMLKVKGDTMEAVKSFYKTVEYDTTHFDAFLQLGILYAAKHDPLAIRFYQTAHRLRPGNVEPLYDLGMYYQEQGNFNDAIQAYTDAIAISPRYKFAHFNLGYIHIELKVYSEAARHFTNAISCDPNYVEGYYGRGYALEMMGDVLNAQEDYNQCLRLRPNHQGAIEGLQRIARHAPPQ